MNDIHKLRLPLHLQPLRQPQHEVHPYPNVKALAHLNIVNNIMPVRNPPLPYSKPSSKLQLQLQSQIDKAGDKVFLSDNYQVHQGKSSNLVNAIYVMVEKVVIIVTQYRCKYKATTTPFSV